PHLPTSSYPSGHLAATVCLYTGIAVIVLARTDRWWRWLFVAMAVLMPVLVALSRMYRGMHHPTDLVGSLVLAFGWLAVTIAAVRPNAERSGAEKSVGATAEHPYREDMSIRLS